MWSENRNAHPQHLPDKMELTRLTERVFCINGPVNVGVILLDNSNVALIDSGNDAKYAGKIFELLSDYRFKITHILNTHAHADHIGGNSFFQEKTNCRIFASTLEAPTINQPMIQAAVLFSGAPLHDLMNRFTMANPSHVEIFTDNHIQLDELHIEIIDLPGHSVNQKGFIIDEIAFLADTLFPENFFKKQRLPFNYDPAAHQLTLERIRKLKAKTFIGGHFAHTSSIQAMIATNLNNLETAMEFMRALLKVPQPQERIVKSFLDHFGLKKTNWEYFLYRANVNGYLSALYRHGEIRYKILDNLPIWYAV